MPARAYLLCYISGLRTFHQLEPPVDDSMCFRRKTATCTSCESNAKQQDRLDPSDLHDDHCVLIDDRWLAIKARDGAFASLGARPASTYLPDSSFRLGHCGIP